MKKLSQSVINKYQDMPYTEQAPTKEFPVGYESNRLSNCQIISRPYKSYMVDGEVYYSHRVAATLNSGNNVYHMGRELYASHLCGNANCKNPVHIIYATARENNHHRKIHMTSRANNKLSNTEVLEIRYSVSLNKYTYQEIADTYNISPRAVGAIALGESYKHVGGPIKESQRKYSDNTNYQNPNITKKVVIDIKQKYELGLTTKEISKLFDLTVSTVQRIISGSNYND